MRTNRVLRIGSMLVLLQLFLCYDAFAGKKNPPVPLTPQGEKLQAKYAGMLVSCRKEVLAAIPEVDENKKAAFLAADAEIGKLRKPGKDAAPSEVKAYTEAREKAEAEALAAARPLLKETDAFLASDRLDAKLMRIAVLTDATPRGLAEFAQQGKEEEALVEELLGDDALMKQMLLAGGANGAEWGEAMQVYHAILASSEHARKPGILQRLALGTALQQPWLDGKEKGGVYGIVHADNRTPADQVSRYLHYEKAYLAGELDPAFKDMNTWECRFITNDPYTDEELAWTRKMLRNYRPDHITNPDYKWRYARMVKSDVPYCSPDWRPDEGTSKVQQIVTGGGKCGPRAFFGRTVCRAFGIPSRRSTQSGHAAMNHWTPDGWVICFGAWWSVNWAGPWGGLDFLLESQAREHPKEFMKVLRSQWVGAACDEEKVSIRHYGKGGGFWNALAFQRKRAVVEDARIKALELMGGMELGESDNLIGDEKGTGIKIPEANKKIVTEEDGTIIIPAVACTKPKESTDRVLFIQDLSDEYLVHYGRLGKRPELLRYDLRLPKAGKYKFSMHFVNVARDQSMILRVNRRTFIDVAIPFALGEWTNTQPVEVKLREGPNSLMFTWKTPNRGVTIKHFKLTPLR